MACLRYYGYGGHPGLGLCAFLFLNNFRRNCKIAWMQALELMLFEALSQSTVLFGNECFFYPAPVWDCQGFGGENLV